MAVTPAGRIVAAVVFDDAATAGFFHGVWRAFYTNMRLVGVGIACLGLLLVALRGAMLEAADPVQRAREFLSRMARTPAQRWRRFVRAAAFLAAGALTILWPGTTAAIVAVVLGLALAYTGLRELSILIGTVSVAGAGRRASPRAPSGSR